MKEAKQKFAQTMGKQQAAQKQQQTTQQAGQQKFVGQRNAHAALMARQGLQSQAKFQSLLKTSTQENVQRAESDTKNRTEDLQEKSTARAEDSQELNRQEAVQGDKLGAIDPDQGRGGSGGASQNPGGGGGGDRGPEGIAGAGAAAQAEQAPASHGPQQPKLPEAVLQELVKRVMVGVDAKGMGTFVVQLKDDVLGGASMQITAQNGKISAKFSVSDDNTARLLKASEGALARAFGRKGMSLESLTVERR